MLPTIDAKKFVTDYHICCHVRATWCWSNTSGKVTSEITLSVSNVRCHLILSIGKCFILIKELSWHDLVCKVSFCNCELDIKVSLTVMQLGQTAVSEFGNLWIYYYILLRRKMKRTLITGDRLWLVVRYGGNLMLNANVTWTGSDWIIG